jgi:flagellar biosynthesis protein FlhG
MDKVERRSELGKVLAIVSGKGGSGKPRLATAMGIELAESGHSVVLVDADLGTGGLTYYLGFSAFSGARTGVADIVMQESQSPDVPLSYPNDDARRNLDIRHAGSLALLPVGDHRRALRLKGKSTGNMMNLQFTFEGLREHYDVVIVDCRGGADSQSLAVCELVDEILIVVETDAASIKASQHLTDTLSDRDLSSKVAGFILNKVMDDPRALANAGRSFFSTQFLAAVPFELETTRDFIRGFLPRPGSLFRKQVNLGLRSLFPHLDIDKYSNYMSETEFSVLSTEPPEIKTGRSFIGLVIAATVIFYLVYFNFGEAMDIYPSVPFEIERTIVQGGVVGLFALLAISALSATILSAIGRLVRVYLSTLDRVLKMYTRLFRRF